MQKPVKPKFSQQPSVREYRLEEHIYISLNEVDDFKKAYEVLSSTDYEYFTLNEMGVTYVVLEAEAKMQKRIQEESCKFNKWSEEKQIATDRYNEELRKYQAYQKEMNRKKYNDPEYIEFLRMKSKLENKGIEI